MGKSISNLKAISSISKALDEIIGARIDGAYSLSLYTRCDILPGVSQLANEPAIVLVLGIWIQKSIL